MASIKGIPAQNKLNISSFKENKFNNNTEVVKKIKSDNVLKFLNLIAHLLIVGTV